MSKSLELELPGENAVGGSKSSCWTGVAWRDYLNESICGLVNAAIVIPVMFSFANIIFRDPIFSPYLPLLSKLVMFSGVVHQSAFLIFSNFPFAIGKKILQSY